MFCRMGLMMEQSFHQMSNNCLKRLNPTIFDPKLPKKGKNVFGQTFIFI